MLKRYLLFISILVFAKLAIAGAPVTGPVSNLYLHQQVQAGEFSMVITHLTGDGSGEGVVFVPFLHRSVTVAFEDISVSDGGELLSGTLRAGKKEVALPDFRNTEQEATAFLELAYTNDELPLNINSELAAAGISAGDHDMVMTDLFFTEAGAWMDAAYIVQNPNGRVTTFTAGNIAVSKSDVALCDARFLLLGDPQTPEPDAGFPIVIKAYNPDTGEGTYLSFSCDGFESFHLVGEYHFDTRHLRLVDVLSPQDTVIASFSLETETWGQFLATVTFNGPFEIRGVDDVIITVTNATIDYSDSANPVDPAMEAYLAPLNIGANKNIWRGFFIKDISVQLPGSMAVNNGSRVTLQAQNLIYDRARGLTTTFLVTGNPTIIAGNLEGWGIDLRRVELNVLYSSPIKFEINGNLNIPLVREPITYAARFNFPTGGGVTQTRASLSFVMTLSNEYTVPLLKNAKMVLTNSVAGFEYTTNKFTPYAHLNGTFDLGFSSGDAGVAADFKFPALGFQGLTLNYDVATSTVVPEATPSGGLKTMTFQAFSFAGQVFTNNFSTPTSTGSTPPPAPAPVAETGGTATTPQQTVKGFPIAVRDIKFGNVGDDKKLDFTIALNFTSPSVGLTASAALSVIGNLDVAKVITSRPWEAMSFKSLQLNSILIGSEAQPVNLGGVKLYGGLLVIRKDAVYGDGFKGFLVMTIEPGITVQVVGQFGTISKADNSLDYRYFFADAKATIPTGVRLGPLPIAVYGLGGGFYYNMTQSLPPAASTLDVSTASQQYNIPTGGAFTMSNDLMTPGRGLSCTYVPSNGILGINASVVLGTHSKPETANMDLTLSIEFNLSPFGLRQVRLNGAAYFMAPITKRNQAKVKGTTAIIYNHVDGILLFDGNIEIKVNVGTTPLLTGGGNFSMFFNLKAGQSDDWYIAIGAPPIAKRMSLDFKLFGPSQRIETYFVAGNLNRLPADQRNLPLLREYDPMLQEFEGKNNLNLAPLLNGNGILMGARYVYDVSKKIWILQCNLGFTVGFDAILTQEQCAGHTPTGIDNWYIRGQIYGALRGSLKIKVNLFFHKGTYTIASINAAALVSAEFPNPTWMVAKLAGSYRILGGMVKGKFKIEVEMGEKCVPVQEVLNPGDVVAKIKVIGDILPADKAIDIPVYREKLVITSFLENVNGVMDFSEESEDGLMVKPIINSVSITGPQTVQGNWRHYSGTGAEVGPNGLIKSSVFNSTKLLAPRARYTYTIRISWQMKTRDNGTWRDIILKDVRGRDSVQYFETKTISFTAGDRPSILPREAVLASYPEYGAVNYCIYENPAGGGIALKQDGWGYLFNPKRRAIEEVTPCNPDIVEYDYFVRIVDAATSQPVVDRGLTAVPPPEWGMTVGDPVYTIQRPCVTGNPFWDWLYRWLNISCEIYSQGPCRIQQPTRAQALSNVKNMANTWSFGGTARNFDLAVTQNTNIANRSIGFPDLSDVLDKNKVYKFLLVAKPVPVEDTYTVSANTQTDTTVTTSRGEYTVTSASNSLQAQYTVGATEKQLYQSHFGTSSYNTFAEKLAASRPTYESNNSWYLNVGEDTLFVNAKDFEVVFRFVSMGIININFSNRAYPILNETDYWMYVLMLYWNSPPQYPYTMEYRLADITEGFDAYEMGKFAYFAQYNRNQGYVKYQINEKPDLVAFEKSNTFPFDNSIIPRGPWVFLLPPSQQTSFLSTTAVTKTNATELKLRFYPRTVSQYKIVKKFLFGGQLSAAFKGLVPNPYPLATYKSDLEGLAAYENMPASYGDLFRLNYQKGNTNANLVFNKSGAYSGSYVDFSGEYYVRNVGSGRAIHEHSGASAEYGSGWQVNDNFVKFIFERQNNGYYKVKNKGTGRYLGVNGTQVKGISGGIEVVLLPQNDGTFKIQRVSDSAPIYEHQSTGMLLCGTGTFYDYDLFTLETEWKTEPERLNFTRRIRLEANGRYIYDGNDRPGETLASTKDNKGDRAQFFFRRRALGYYDIIAQSGRRVHAEQAANDWIYTTTSRTDLSEEHYLFELERVANQKYRLKNIQSGEYLYENFDIDFGAAHRQVLGAATRPSTDDAVFELVGSGSHTAPSDLSGQYLLQNFGSGRFLHDDGTNISTRVQENTTSSRFILKKMTASGQYEIWNKETKQRMHSIESGAKFQTRNTSLAAAEYRYTITTADQGVSYSIKKAGNTAAVYEKFDFGMGAEHRLLTMTGTGDEDYGRFKMLQERNADGADTGNKFATITDYSGKYFIQTKGSERYLQYDPANPLFADYQSNYRLFVLKKRNGAPYEIWCSNNAFTRRLSPSTDGGYTFDGTATDANAFFNASAVDGGVQFVHQASNQILFEHFEPGSANDRKLRSAASAGNHYTVFLLKNEENSVPDYTGTWAIRGKNSNRYWQDNFLSNNTPEFATSLTKTAPGNRFKLTRLISGGYIMESPAGVPVVLTVREVFGSSVITSTGFNIEINGLPDGSVGMTIYGSSPLRGMLRRHFSESDDKISAVPIPVNRLFFLEPINTTNPNLSGEYRLQVNGSGKYLQLNASKSACSGTSDQVFVLQQQGTGVYEIRDKVSNEKLHAARDASGNWYYTIAPAANLTAQHYQFRFTPSGNNLYTIQCVANQEFVYEHFDLNTATFRHEKILSAAEKQGEYGLFSLQTAFTPCPVSYSGTWLVKSKGSNKYVHGAGINEGGLLTTNASQSNDDHLLFVFKRRASGQYEIYNLGSGRVVRAFQSVPVTVAGSAGDTLFTVVDKGNSSYEIRVGSSKIYEMTTTPPDGPKHGQIFSTGAGASGYDLFALESSYLRPDDMSGEYCIRTAGSGRLMFNNGTVLSTSPGSSNAQVRFILERQSGNIYKIKSRSDGQYLHLAAGSTYTTAAATELPANHYEFKLFIAANNMYRFQCAANNEWLYENFDLDLGPQHRQILGKTTENSDYSFFSLQSAFAPAPEDLSGRFIIRIESNGRVLHTLADQKVSTTWSSVDGIGLWFTLKRRASGEYEIWSKLTGQRVRSVQQSSGYNFVASALPSGVPENVALFQFTKLPNGTYLIKNNGGGYLDETALEVLNTSAMGDQFRLVPQFIPVKDISGTYHFKNLASNRHLVITNGMLNTTWSENTPMLQFIVEKQPNNAFKIKCGGNGQYLHTEGADRFSTTPANLPAAAYEFNFTEANNGTYRIQSRQSGKYLYEFFDLNLGPNHRQIYQTEQQELEDNQFFLETNHVSPAGPEFSGVYFVSLKVTGGIMNLTSTQTVAAGSNNDKWIFKPRAGGEFEIFDFTTQKRIAVNSIGQLAGMQASVPVMAAARFTLVSANGFYRIRTLGNSQFLYENFDVNLGPSNRLIMCSSATKDDDGLFKISELPPAQQPANMFTGQVMLWVKGSQRYVSVKTGNSGALNTAFNPGDINEARFVFRLVSGGFYEIWNKYTQQRVGMNTTGVLACAPMPADNYLFTITGTPASLRIRSKATGLAVTEIFTIAGPATELRLAGAPPSNSVNDEFVAESVYKPVDGEDLTGLYSIRVSGSARYFMENNNPPLTTGSAQMNYYLRRRAGGNYEMYSVQRSAALVKLAGQVMPASAAATPLFTLSRVNGAEFRILNGSDVLREEKALFSNTFSLKFTPSGLPSTDKFFLQRL